MRMPHFPAPPAIWVIAALCCALGSSLAYSAVAYSRVTEAQKALERAKADARKAWDKVYDQQEGFDEQLEAAKWANQTELWTAQQELEKCRAKVAKEVQI